MHTPAEENKELDGHTTVGIKVGTPVCEGACVGASAFEVQIRLAPNPLALKPELHTHVDDPAFALALIGHAGHVDLEHSACTNKALPPAAWPLEQVSAYDDRVVGTLHD